MKKVYLIVPALKITLDPITAKIHKEWLSAEEKMMLSKIPLCGENSNAFLRRSRYKASMGMLSIASYLQKHGTSVEYIDEQVERNRGTWDETLKEIAENSLLVGITTMTATYSVAIDTIKRLKSISHNTFIVVGGSHVNYCFEEPLSEGADVVVHGEGERTLLEFVNYLSSRNGNWQDINGISFRAQDGRIIRNENQRPLDLKTLPAIDFELLPKGERNEFDVYVFASRGCPYSCVYCIEGTFWPKIRYRHIDQVLIEIDNHNRILSHPLIFVNDSSFGANKRFALDLCNAISNNFPNQYFRCMLRADSVDETFARVLRNANFVDIQIGIESGNNNVLKLMNKNEVFETYIHALNILRRHIPIIRSSWILGGPFENLRTIKETIEKMSWLFSEGLIDEASFRMMIPYPGTRIFECPEKFGLQILSKDWNSFHRRRFPPPIRTEDLNEYQIFAGYLLATATAAKHMLVNAGRPLGSPARFT